MSLDEELLESLAKDGQMDYSEWPSLLDQILPKLEHIAYHDFPIPRIPIPDFIPSSQQEELTPSKREPALKEEEWSVEKPSAPEEAIPESTEPPPQDVEQHLPTKDESPDVKHQRISKSPPSNTIAPPMNSLPPPLLSLLQTIQSTLSHSFQHAPPHTAQRLAELLLHPTVHYRTLPSYLRALDRIVSVASPASIFPLPDLTVGASTNGRMLNGTSSPSPDPTSDRDFIGGAELTEIPWLSNSVGSPSSTSISHNNNNNNNNNGPTSDLRRESTSLIDGPNGAGSVETVTVNVNGVSSHNTPREETNSSTGHGITQGELLRQEQEAGIVPVPSSPNNNRVTRSNAAATAAATRAVGLEPAQDEAGITAAAAAGGGEEELESVHARGPGVIGMEDMGPQAPGSGLERGLDLEGALGRRGEGENMTDSSGSGVGVVGGSRGVTTTDRTAREEKQQEEDGDRDGDGDVVVVDADGVVEGGGEVEGTTTEGKSGGGGE